jgi:hypothetical protein
VAEGGGNDGRERRVGAAVETAGEAMGRQGGIGCSLNAVGTVALVVRTMSLTSGAHMVLYFS